MRLGFIGTTCIGKTTLINDFVKQWPMYKVCDKPRYTDILKEKNISINENGNEESQQIILDSLVDNVMGYKKSDNVLFDRTVLDNLAYTIWLELHNKVSKRFVQKTIDIVRESLVFYDIIFFLPITKHAPVEFNPTLNGSKSALYRSDMDEIFKALHQLWTVNDTHYFPFKNPAGCPAIIEIFGSPELRIELLKQYLLEDGKAQQSGGLSIPQFGDPTIDQFR